MTTAALDLGGAAVIGLLASSHCLAMCGGVSAAFGMASSARQPLLITLFSLGRVCCYALLGLLVGLLSHWLGAQYLAAAPWMRLFAGVMLIGIAGYIGGWWMGLQRLEILGQHLWRRLSPLAQRFVPIRAPWQAMLLGVLWGFLPCGLIYSTLVWASLQADSPLGSSALMAAFGLGTLPSMVGIGLLGQKGKQWLAQHQVRRAASVLLLLSGVWTIVGAVNLGPAPHQHAGNALLMPAYALAPVPRRPGQIFDLSARVVGRRQGQAEPGYKRTVPGNVDPADCRQRAAYAGLR